MQTVLEKRWRQHSEQIQHNDEKGGLYTHALSVCLTDGILDPARRAENTTSSIPSSQATPAVFGDSWTAVVSSRGGTSHKAGAEPDRKETGARARCSPTSEREAVGCHLSKQRVLPSPPQGIQGTSSGEAWLFGGLEKMPLGSVPTLGVLLTSLPTYLPR